MGLNYGTGKKKQKPKAKSIDWTGGDTGYDGDSGGISETPTYDHDPNTPGGKMWIWYPADNENGGVWELESSKSESGGGGGSDNTVGLAGIGLGYAELENAKAQTAIQGKLASETIRSNKSTEREMRRKRALDATTAALDAYLEGSRQVDTRRLNAFQEARALLPSLIDPNQKYFGGQEKGGMLDTIASRFGLPFTPTKIQHKTLTPQVLAGAPTPQLVGKEVMGGIRETKAAGKRI